MCSLAPRHPSRQVPTASPTMQSDWHARASDSSYSPHRVGIRPISFAGVSQGVGYEAHAGTLSGGANVVACAGCSEGLLVTNITQSSSVTVSGVVGRNKPQWIALYYVNPDDQIINGLQRLVSVSVNGDAPVILKRRTTAVNVTMSIPFEAYL
ncbi:hypothetical protein B0H14DRAFT_3619893 [Mycena olivaceomarginata]|nr:hypothetical protein B0H14DRAFT_3619893 [Mycena olivaceomarginata]